MKLLFLCGLLLLTSTSQAKVKVKQITTQTESKPKPIAIQEEIKVKPVALKSSRVDKKDIDELKKNLGKIDSSIQLTRNKIKESKEVQFLPDLYFMMAELLVEKAQLMTTLKKEQAPDTPTEELDFSAEKRVRSEAIENYLSIENRFSKYPTLDKVLFTLAQEYRAIDDSKTALQTYKRLIEKYPTSTFYAKSLLEIGNIFFDKKDYEYAIDQYKKVLKLPLNPSTPTAYYKLSWCQVYKGEFLNSLLSFGKVISETQKLDQVDTDLREEALIASAWPFSELKPEDFRDHPEFLRPMEYYRSISFDKASFRRALKRLAARLELKNRLIEVTEINLELFRISDDLDEKLEALEAYYITKKKINVPYYPMWLTREVADSIWKLQQRLDRKTILTKKKPSLYEPLLRDIATSLHTTAMKTQRHEDLSQVVDAYKDFLWIYPKSVYANAIKTNLAEASFRGADFVEAALTYLELASNQKKVVSPEQKREWLKSSVQSFMEAFKDPEKLTQLEKIQGRYGYRKVSDLYSKLFPQDPSIPMLKFNVAKSYYDEQKFTESEPLFQNFILQYPSAKEINEAVILYLDGFYIREDLKQLIEQGQKLLSQATLPAGTKTTVQEVIQQAQLRNVQSLAGEFSSRKYAKKFLEFAEKNKGSALGETALLEAFYSLRSANDPKGLQVGEQFLGQHGSNPKAKEVLASMIQTSLITADFRSAANYLLAYSQKFRNEAVSKDYLNQAALMLEQMGAATEAADAFVELRQIDTAAKILAKYGQWSELAPIAAKMRGTRGLYYQGLAFYRQGAKNDGLALLKRAMNEHPSGAEEKSMAAHAGIIVFENEWPKFLKVGQGVPFSAPILQEKAGSLESLNLILQKVLSQGQGKWSVAALAWTGLLNLEFSAYLLAVSPPTGMNVTQFREMAKTQAQGYAKTAGDVFRQCIGLIDENSVFSNYNEMCSKQGRLKIAEVKEVPVLKTHSAIQNLSSGLRSELLKSPRSIEVLNKLFLNNLKTSQFVYARSVAYRMLEISPQSADAYAYLGLISLFFEDSDLAYEYFQLAIKNEANHALALKGIAGIYHHFNLTTKFLASKALIGNRAPASVPLHPWMKY